MVKGYKVIQVKKEKSMTMFFHHILKLERDKHAGHLNYIIDKPRALLLGNTLDTYYIATALSVSI